MVVFTCGYCGDSVSKPKVEKHYLTRCRGRAPNLSCMDCFKDFYGGEHEAHTKCVSEEQRYAASGFVAAAKKGETKQDAWVQLVQAALREPGAAAAGAGARRILQEVSKHSNTPRKKPKFINFVRNVCGHRTAQADVDQAWSLLAGKLDALRAANQQHHNNNTAQHHNNTTQHNNTNNLNHKANHDQSNLTDDTEVNCDEKQNGDVIAERAIQKQRRKEDKKKKKHEAELESATAPEPSALEADVDAQITEKPKKHKLQQELEIQFSKKKKHKTKVTEIELNEETDQPGKKRKHKKQRSLHTDVDLYNKACIDTKPNGEATQLKFSDENVNNEQEKQEAGNVDNVNECVGETGDDGGGAGKLCWESAIESVLVGAGGAVRLQRLRKRVLREYERVTGRPASARTGTKLDRKLRAMPRVQLDKDKVLLVE